MAKKKSKKSNKNKKKKQQGKKSNQSKKIVAQKKQTQTPQESVIEAASHEQVPLPVSQSSSNNKLIIGFLCALLIALLFGIALTRDDQPDQIESSVDPSPAQGQQNIDVRPPNDETPQATGYNLQGTNNQQGQAAQGGLQQQSGDQLQPNAKIDNYEEVILERE